MEFGSDFVYAGVSDDEDEVHQELTLQESYQCQQGEDGQTCMLDIFDTAGQEEYSTMREQYMLSGDGFLIVYDITNPSSLKEAETIYEWTKAVRNGNSVPAVLCGNKSDLADDRQVSIEDGEKTAQRLGLDFIETSAKTGSNVTAAFEMLVRKIPRTGVAYKIPVVGAGGVGKSAITVRYVSDAFVDSYDPTIEDSYRKRITIPGLATKNTHSKLPAQRQKKINNSSTAIQQAPDIKEDILPKKRSSMFGKLKRRLSFGKKDKKSHVLAAPQPVQVTVPVRKIDTNVISLSLGTLSQEPQLVTGDPYYCKGCRAVLSKVSIDNKHMQTEDRKTLWICEFCGHKNSSLELGDDELPSGDSFDFILSPAPEVTGAGGDSSVSDIGELVIYCIDISGSMGSFAAIPKSQEMWKKIKEGNSADDGTNWQQTRLECIKQAVRRQMETLQVSHPNKKVALVTFGSLIYIHNEAKHTTETVKEKIYNNKDDLLKEGKNIYKKLGLQIIIESFSNLSRIVDALSTTGSTALGPALTICVGMAAKMPGSQIILCTDGSPNVGVGSAAEDNYKDGYYAKLGQTAFKNQTVVSILAVEGDSVGLSYVGQVASASNGTVNIVSPLELTRQVRLITQNPVVATNVTLKVILHPSLVFQEPDCRKDSSELIKKVGNVTQASDLTFRYSVKDKEASVANQRLPFQVQMTHTLLSGMKCLRVICKSLEVTTDREKSEKAVRVAVLGLATVQSSAAMAQGGDVPTAQYILHSAQRLMQRGAVTAAQQEEHYSFVTEAQELDSQLNRLNMGACGTSDQVTRVLSRTQAASRSQYLSASNKEPLYAARCNYDSNLRQQYYNYKC